MIAALQNRLKLAAGFSLATSCFLLATPLLFGKRSAVEILVFANWCFFMASGFFAMFPLPKRGTFSAVHINKLKVWLAVFLAFTIASWTAITFVKA